MAEFELYRYTPSQAGAIVFLLLFLITTSLHTYQLFRTRTWYFISFLLGGFFEWIGYIGRIMASDEAPNYTLGPFILQSTLLLVAPALFAASIYMELDRIILLVEGEKHSLIRRTWLTKIFVTGDVFSFLLQAGGAGIMSGKTPKSFKLGEKIIIIGLFIQVIFFGLFIIVSVLLHTRLRRNPTSMLRRADIPWTKHLRTIYVASALILVRSVFRIIEYIQGNSGYILRHEAFLYVFDSALMLGVMVFFNVVHPSEINALLKGGKAVTGVVKLDTISQARGWTNDGPTPGLGPYSKHGD